MALAVAGIDPGTLTGWAVRTADGTQHCGVWRLPGPEAGAMRLDEIERRLSSLRSRLPFDQLAYETGYWTQQRPQIAELLIEIGAVIKLWAHRSHVPVVGYTPGQVKNAFGRGNLEKEAMVKIANLLGWPAKVHHAADASACAHRLLYAQLRLAI